MLGGGLVGALNVGLLGALGWLGYVHWEVPRWDRRVVSAVSVGLLALYGGEGYLAVKFRESRS